MFINNKGKTVISRYRRAVKITNKLVSAKIIANTPAAIEAQIKDLLRWTQQNIESIEKVI